MPDAQPSLQPRSAGGGLPNQRVEGSTALVRLGKRLRPRVDRILSKYSRIGDEPVVDPRLFEFTKLLEANWPAIRKEAEAIMAERQGVHPLVEVSPDHEGIADDKRWKSFFLVGYGYKLEHNCARCPETTKVLEQIPGINSGFFSIMEAGSHIPAHRGVTKAILTCHLGVIVPKDASDKCRIRVDDRYLAWKEGEAFVFDDAYDHEAWNETDEDRVVLLVQFKRPMRWPGRLLGNVFLGGVRASSFVQDARKNLLARDKASGAANVASSRMKH